MRARAEFVAEIHSGKSTILFLPQYREPMIQRILEACRDILRPYPEYPGRERWSDRVFYRCDDGTPRTLAGIWQRREPRLAAATAAAVQSFAATRFRAALRWFFSERGEQHP